MLTPCSDASDKSVSVNVVRAWSDVARIANQWNALDSLRENECPFSSYEFAAIWWQHFGSAQCEPLVMLAYSEERLVGLAPFYIRRQGPFGIPTLHFIGQGEAEEDEVCAEYLDVIAMPGYECEVSAAIARCLIETGGWGRLLVKDMLASSLFSRHIVPALGSHWSAVYQEETGQRYRVRLPQSWDDYLAGLKQNHRRKINLARRRLAEQSNVEFRDVDDSTDLAASMSVLAELHGKRWSQMGLKGSFSSQRFLSFHLDWAKELLLEGKLRLLFLYIDDTPVASIYLINGRPSAFYYQSGADTEQWSRLSPGRLLLCRAIEDAIGQQLTWFDFMRGGDSSYKNSYGCEESIMYKAAVFRPSAWGVLAWTIYKARGLFRSQWHKWSARYDR